MIFTHIITIEHSLVQAEIGMHVNVKVQVIISGACSIPYIVKKMLVNCSAFDQKRTIIIQLS